MVSEYPPVYVVDRDSAARKSLAARIASQGRHVDTFQSVEALLESRGDFANPATPQGREDPLCIVYDLRTPGVRGIELQRALVESGRDVPWIAITTTGNVSAAVDAMQAGAVTVLEEPCSDARLWESIQQAEAWRARRIHSAHARREIAGLSESERAVLELIVEGRTNKQIRDALDLGLRTVELRRSTIMKALGARNIADLIRIVMEAKLSTSFSEDAFQVGGARFELGHQRAKRRGPHVQKKSARHASQSNPPRGFNAPHRRNS